MKLLLRPIRVDSVRVLKALGPFCLWQCLFSFSFLQLFVFVRIHFNFKISTKLKLRNFDWTSALFSSRLQLQNLDLTSASKLYQKWKICQNFSNLFGLASKHFCECQGKAMIDKKIILHLFIRKKNSLKPSLKDQNLRHSFLDWLNPPPPWELFRKFICFAVQIQPGIAWETLYL